MTAVQSFPLLRAPIRVGSVELPNRVVMAPMTSRYATPEGHASDRQVAYYERRARSGVGMIIVEGASVRPDGRGWVPHLSAEDDKTIEGLAQLAGAIRRWGSVPVLQLMHCGRQTRSAVIGCQPVAPSALPCPRFGEIPRELSWGEIQKLRAAFVAAAIRARRAGFVGVELHAAHGYLLNQFLSPYSNRRRDEYGGDLAGRIRLLVEIVQDIRSQCGKEFLLLVRISVHEYVDGGLTATDGQDIARLLGAEGVDAIHVSGTVYGSYPRWVGSMPAGTGYEHFVPWARAIRQAAPVPVLAVGRILFPDQAEAILRRGDADLVVLGRALLADAEWMEKVRRGTPELICPCIGCGACNGRTRRPEITCLADAATGREIEFGTLPDNRGRKVVILGASLPGLTAAIWLARSGAKVAVVEDAPVLGGLLGLRARVPRLEEFWGLVKHHVVEVNRLGGRIVPDPWRPDQWLGQGWLHLVIARHGHPWPLEVGSGSLTGPVMKVEDILSGRLPNGPCGVICGGGLAGIETADYLAERGYKVRIVERGPTIGFDGHPSQRFWRTKCIEEKVIPTVTNAMLLEYRDKRVSICRVDGSLSTLEPVDFLVNAQGWQDVRAEDHVPSAMLRQFLSVSCIGDSYDPSDLAEIVYRSARLPFEIQTE